MSILVLANDLLLCLNQIKRGYKLQQFIDQEGNNQNHWCLHTPSEILEFDDITEVVDFLDDELWRLREAQEDKNWWAKQDNQWSLKRHGKALDDAIDAYMES